VCSLFHQLRRSFIFSEVAAYLAGILLSLGVIIVWPALMLLADVFSKSTFVGWTLMVFIWGIVAAVYVGVVPPILELLQVGLNSN
jgi:uncharacterized membrane protein YcjF (UPF0283 family)